MNCTTTLPAWVDRVQADIIETDSKWRSLDEGEWRRIADGGKENVRAKHAIEEEAGELHAEFVVASFLNTFRGEARSVVGQTIITRLRTNAWSDSTINRLGFAMLLQSEAERAAFPDVEIHWGPATSTRDSRAGGWWVDVDALYLWHGEEVSRQHYRFHVVDDRIEEWEAHLHVT